MTEILILNTLQPPSKRFMKLQFKKSQLIQYLFKSMISATFFDGNEY